METDDPRVALGAKDVTTRSAAARDLAKIGTWDDLPELVRMATEDKSSAVRLYTAAAAADIVNRHRGAAGQTAMTDEQRKQVRDWVKGLDPGHNTGIVMMLSALADKPALDQLGRMLRDPRNGVRAGATTALRRMALSAAGNDEVVRDAVAGWLAGGKAPPDVVLELVRLIGETGWRGLDAELRNAAAAGRLHLAAAEEARARVEKRNDPATWQGVWASEGLDVLEVAAKPRKSAWVVVDDGAWLGQGGKSAAFALQDGVAKAGGKPVRLVWAPRVGEHEARLPALQRNGATYWRHEGKDLAAFVDEHVAAFTPADARAVSAIARWLEPIEGAPAQRARALALWKGGDPEGGLAVLEELVAGKKPRTDVYWWIGRINADLDRKEPAIAALDQFLDKAAKRADWRKEAEALRATLG